MDQKSFDKNNFKDIKIDQIFENESQNKLSTFNFNQLDLTINKIDNQKSKLKK